MAESELAIRPSRMCKTHFIVLVVVALMLAACTSSLIACVNAAFNDTHHRHGGDEHYDGRGRLAVLLIVSERCRSVDATRPNRPEHYLVGQRTPDRPRRGLLPLREVVRRRARLADLGASVLKWYSIGAG